MRTDLGDIKREIEALRHDLREIKEASIIVRRPAPPPQRKEAS
jgi:hypothetical protein